MRQATGKGSQFSSRRGKINPAWSVCLRPVPPLPPSEIARASRFTLTWVAGAARREEDRAKAMACGGVGGARVGVRLEKMKECVKRQARSLRQRFLSLTLFSSLPARPPRTPHTPSTPLRNHGLCPVLQGRPGVVHPGARGEFLIDGRDQEGQRGWREGRGLRLRLQAPIIRLPPPSRQMVDYPADACPLSELSRPCGSRGDNAGRARAWTAAHEAATLNRGARPFFFDPCKIPIILLLFCPRAPRPGSLSLPSPCSLSQII